MNRSLELGMTNLKEGRDEVGMCRPESGRWIGLAIGEGPLTA